MELSSALTDEVDRFRKGGSGRCVFELGAALESMMEWEDKKMHIGTVDAGEQGDSVSQVVHRSRGRDIVLDLAGERIARCKGHSPAHCRFDLGREGRVERERNRERGN